MGRVHEGSRGGDNTNDNTATNARCCSRFCAEFSLPFFGTEDFNGQTLDLEGSFCTDKQASVGCIKAVLMLWIISLLVVDWIRTEHPDFFLAFLTQWSLVYAVVYSILSFSNTWCCDSKRAIHATWVFFSIAATHQVAIICLFWFLEYDPSTYDLTYSVIMAHGGVCVLVFIDGLVINRIPVRLKHFFVSFLFALLYLVWTLIQNLIINYNPFTQETTDNENGYGSGRDDDAVYSVISWDRDPTGAAIISAGVLFVYFPLLFVLVWALSLPGRRYVPLEDPRSDAPEFEQPEMEEAPSETNLSASVY